MAIDAPTPAAHGRDVPLDRPSEEFYRQVKDALEHVLDVAYLQRHALSHSLGVETDASRTIIGQRLRRALVDAIEVLMPESRAPLHSPHARSYHMIRLHYLQGMTVEQAAQELSVSPRQAYRDLRLGEESVADVLWARWRVPEIRKPSVAEASSIEAEMAHLELHVQPTDLVQLLDHAWGAVGRIAEQRQVRLDLELPRKPVTISADPLLARQVLVSVLSRAVQIASPGQLSVVLAAKRGQASVSVSCGVEEGSAGAARVDFVAVQLIDKLGWVIEEEQTDNMLHTVVRVMTPGPTILIIDDNVGLVRLLERYLTDQACRVVTALNGHEGLRLAQELVPDVIVLDVMMPEIDGWALLQRLRNHPNTATVPVIICSVINDQALAYSLGASLVLHKPVSRAMILDALHELGVV